MTDSTTNPTITPGGRSEQINELAAALSVAQGQIKPAVKDSENPHFRSKYADIASVWDACREALAANKLAVVQLTHDTNGQGVVLETILLHASGQWISGRLRLRPVKDDPQGVGSAITYARRYGLQAMVGIASEDDDGNAASQGGPSATHRKTPAPPDSAKTAAPSKPRGGRAKASEPAGVPTAAQVLGDAADVNGDPRRELMALVQDWTAAKLGQPASGEALVAWCRGVCEAAGGRQKPNGLYDDADIARAVEWALPRVRAGEELPGAVG